MTEEEIIDKLQEDEHYYGDFGKQFRSNSDIGTLLSNPLALGKDFKKSPALLIGGYFHTAILEPDKLINFRVVESSTRNTKMYKEISGGEMCLLQHEVDQIDLMTETVLNNDVCRSLIRGPNIEYERPALVDLEGLKWKGKADIINHEEKLVIDLKTSGDINRFRSSAFRYNYDSQAYIYSKLFGYEMLFIVIDKTTKQIGLFDCSPDFYEGGKDKVQRAAEQYKLFYDNPNFDPKNYFLTKTL
jgi:hypothetical protein